LIALQKTGSTMVNLKELISGISHLKLNGQADLNINAFHYDSRKIRKGDLFIALTGEQTDGHIFIKQAIEKGAIAVMYEKGEQAGEATFIKVENTRTALTFISDAFFGFPSKKMKFIGITGTNGKTTTAYLIKSIFDAAGIKSGLLGTINYDTGKEKINAQLTTPEPVIMHKYLRDMYLNGCSHCILEVSSHSLSQERVKSLKFSTAIVTSISQDHLDYHRDMQEYISTKIRLIELLSPRTGYGIINSDLDSAPLFYTKASSKRLLKYSLFQGKGDIYPESFDITEKEISASLVCPEGKIKIRSQLTGDFNLYNIMAALGAGISNKIPLEQIKQGIEALKFVPGRLEPVRLGQDFTLLVDYAHTPDAMENVLTFIKNTIKGRVITLFGCGGDRDKGKRPEMGRIAEHYSDFVIVTSDNPRKENPFVIIDQILTGVKNRNKVEILVDRSEAIKQAVNLAKKNDIILIFGKGHEDYQILGEDYIPFDDRLVASEYILKKMNNNG